MGEPCPGLDLQHGFLNYIRNHQFLHAEQGRQQGKFRSKAGHPLTFLRKETIQELFISGRPEQEIDQMDLVDIEETLTLTHPESDRDVCTLNIFEVDLAQYMPEAQPYILQAIKDPARLPPAKLSEVAVVIVNRGWEDPVYNETAAAVCHYIVEKERQQQSELAIPSWPFRRNLVSACQDLIKQWQKMRQHNLQYWLSLSRFLAQCYKQICINCCTIDALADLLFQCLENLAQPPCVCNFDEVELLSSLFHDHGCDLQKDDSDRMEQLVSMVRDTFLLPGTEPKIRRILLLLIELYASNWELSDCAKAFHFHM